MLEHVHDPFVERDWRDKQKVVDNLKDTVDRQRRDLDSVRKEMTEKEMLCSALRVGFLSSVVSACYLHRRSVVVATVLTQCFGLLQKQMTYLETQQNDVQAAKDEARRLKVKMKTFERYLERFYCGPDLKMYFWKICFKCDQDNRLAILLL